MKTLLTALTTLSISTPPTLAPIATNSSTIASDYSLDVAWLPPTSMEALQKSVNDDFESKQTNPVEWAESLAETVQRKYSEYCAGKTANLSIFSMNPVSETIDETFQDTYVNNTPNTQTFQTQEYSKEVSNTATFSVDINESFSVSVSTTFMFASASISADLSSSKTWTNTTTVTETITAPAQAFVVDPFSKGIATYVIKSGVYNVKGMLRYVAPLDGNSGFSTGAYRDDWDTIYTYKYEELIGILDSQGYGDLIKLDARDLDFSIISTDNPKDPSVVAFNIPITYVSHGGKMNVSFSQEPLN